VSREERRARWEALFDPSRLALTGVALSVILVFQPALAGRIAILAGAMAAALLSGRRVSPVMAAVVMAGIVGANLLVPLGRKLAEWGPLVITELALREGIEKSVTFEALMMISKACLGSSFRLPGRFGLFFAEALGSYDRFLEKKKSIKLGSVMKDIDEILFSVYYIKEVHSSIDSPSSRHTGARWSDLALGVTVVVSMVPILLG
jgi:hypothetical protein